MKELLLLNGPNLNLLGEREPGVYGAVTLEDIERQVRDICKQEGWQLKSFQSNHEGDLVDAIHEARHSSKGIIFNPGAYTHTSVALRDAISGVNVPMIEVHISNVHKRESFRHTSLLSPVSWGQIVGLGPIGYQLAAKAFIDHFKEDTDDGEAK
ncbi:type II 3-dehydroquinate dehydratase [Pontibacillus yanchengensis]|uniref:3-dehydroquinate dehydratase n=1 Tax=Pontibacillus yanchengensis Y32 TaxID=1385514 RepID=A0A0A2TBM0_9BACI|nr:type II 3-dehydroquinate dehydratase [Pontibacillus yanchengensis]KGP72934.1 3-dehydroquinate dehydratase [Pontibacillus yanchengensis Y32]